MADCQCWERSRFHLKWIYSFSTAPCPLVKENGEHQAFVCDRKQHNGHSLLGQMTVWSTWVYQQQLRSTSVCSTILMNVLTSSPANRTVTGTGLHGTQWWKSDLGPEICFKNTHSQMEESHMKSAAYTRWLLSYIPGRLSVIIKMFRHPLSPICWDYLHKSDLLHLLSPSRYVCQ